MKKFSLIVLTLLFAIAPLASAYYTPDGADVTTTGTIYQGATDNAFTTRTTVTDPTANRVITYPDSSETVGTASAIEDNLILSADLADEDWGDVSVSSNSVTIDASVIDKANFADEDWGDLSVSSNSVTLDANVVDTAELTTDATDATILQDVVAASGANTACATTCGIAGCYFGFDTGSSVFVACDGATADTCACDGATS